MELSGTVPVITGHDGAQEELLHTHQGTSILLEPNSRRWSSKHDAPACEAPRRGRRARRTMAFCEDEARLVVASRRDMGVDLGHAKRKLEGKRRDEPDGIEGEGAGGHGGARTMTHLFRCAYLGRGEVG
jgi:hypothetical protein